ncbi:MAG: NADH-quinone oxidoreductase subunit L [Planctomycetaceae bacterium]|nr:NADH-quinone oxidoreductase subunit L [Planctomycetaceae bacterium]
MNERITYCLILIPALPLLAAVIVAVLGPKLLRSLSHIPVILGLAGASVCSLILVAEVLREQDSLPTDREKAGFEQVVTLWTWANVPDAYNLPGDGATLPPHASRDVGWRDFRIDISLRADALTAMMLGMVTFVATLVAVFAAGYMEGDRGYWRFFAYIGLFVFSMTMLVSVSNFLLLFVFWEAVGVCSYLLIGFWYEKPEAAAAGKKAFLVNRVGDFAFTVAMFLIWCTYGTLNYHDSLADGTTDPQRVVAATADSPPEQKLIRGVLGQDRILAGDYKTGWLATAICLLLLLGACGKSAQFPLHVWLPDAMEGPTPVSALIHAATMVTAGVYMVARCTPLFAASPTAQLVVAITGGFTALLAGLIALTQFDLKRILAYSTISQLGYMFLALGAGTVLGVTGGMFHLFTHAFFKALLFLGAGSVMHAMGGIIDIRQFGGLRRLMPWTHATFLIGCLALSGVFPLAGFWSKDTVLAAVHHNAIEHELERRVGSHPGHPDAEPAAPGPLAGWTAEQLATARLIYEVLYYGALFTSFLTALYTFRAFCLTFYGQERIPDQAGHHAHESPPLMVAPLAVLAVCSIFVGMAFVAWSGSWGGNILANFLEGAPSLAAGAIATTKTPPEFHLDIAGYSTLVALAGILSAMFLYMGGTKEATVLKRLFDLQGADRLTDPEWIAGLERIPWISATTKFLRSIYLGWVVTLVGYALGAGSLVLAIPLLVGQFISPYKLSQNKFYFDEIYAALVVWPLSILASICYWIDRWIVDGLVNAAGMVPAAIGSLMRSLQMGLVQFYALAMVLGALVLVAARLIWAAG